MSDEEFMDAVGAVNLLPGPNSTELALHIGRRQAGTAGRLLAALGVHELVVLLAAGLMVLAVRMPSRALGAAAGVVTLVPWLPAVVPAVAVPGVGWLFLFFFKTGAVLYGSGYVLLSFLRSGLVEWGGWLTEAQLLDAVAAGQLTPGPVFTTATFIGYLLHGLSGGLVATAGIFLPAFLFVGMSGAIIPWLRRSPPARAFLDGVNAGSVALMAVVTWELGRHALTSPWLGALAAASVLLLQAGVNSSWLVAGGALAGALLR